MSKVISVAVCDDDETMLPIIAGVVQATFPAEGATVETFSSAKQFCDRMEENGFDLLFLDIDMPETDGIELGLKLRNAKRNIDIVYVSEREDRVFESFKVHPFGFVRKRNFLKDIRSVAKLWLDSREAVPADKFVIEGTKGSLAVQLSEIIYIESMKKTQYVHIKGVEEPFGPLARLKNFWSCSPATVFCSRTKVFLSTISISAI